MVKANKYLKVCRKCQAACCKLSGPDLSEKEMKKILKAGFRNYFRKVGKNHYEMISIGGRCSYLKKDNSCEIHKVKPFICLCWPVLPKYKGNKRKYVIVECPITPLLSKKDIEKCKKEASKIPKNILYNCWKMSSLSKAEIKLIKKRFTKFKIKKLD